MEQSNISQWLQAINPFGRTETRPEKVEKNLAGFIAPVQLQRLKQDVQSWREVLTEAENVWFPHRVKAQRLFIDTINNGHVFACMERRKDLTLLRKWDFVNAKGDIDEKVTALFLDTVNGQSQNKEWFNKFLNYSIDSIYFGYSLISLGDIIENQFPEIEVIKRWNISPDRLNVTNFTYSISGAMFLEEPYKNWHVYVKTYNDIGASKAGYGLLYKVALYEIFLRNLLGFNGDFVELFAQPYRLGKTSKSNESERAELANAIQMMGSSGWAMIDPEDEITFLESALGGTGYKGYDNLEQRLEKKISKIILGHADAIDSIAGKLGNSGEKSPAERSLEDKQTKDGSFIANVVNNGLIVNMRALGFKIPDDIRALLKNDAEMMEINNAVIAQAVEMNKAGLIMDSAYFTKQTGIPVAVAVAPVIAQSPITSSIKSKLEMIYNKTSCNHSH